MKQREKCSGPGFDAGRSTKSVLVLVYFWWAWIGFDRANSNRVDSTVGDDRKSSKLITANDELFLAAA